MIDEFTHYVYLMGSHKLNLPLWSCLGPTQANFTVPTYWNNIYFASSILQAHSVLIGRGMSLKFFKRVIKIFFSIFFHLCMYSLIFNLRVVLKQSMETAYLVPSYLFLIPMYRNLHELVFPKRFYLLISTWLNKSLSILWHLVPVLRNFHKALYASSVTISRRSYPW